MTMISEINIPSAFTKLRDDPIRIVGFGIATILFMFLVNYIQGNGLADGFDMVGIKKRSFSQLPAKLTYMWGGRDMMYGAMAKLKRGFYVCSLEGPVSSYFLTILREVQDG
jgi:hypothetical protein